MFERCFADGEFKQALGISIESRRLDKLRQCILESKRLTGDLSQMINHCFDLATNLNISRDFKQKVCVPFYNSDPFILFRSFNAVYIKLIYSLPPFFIFIFILCVVMFRY